MLDHAEIDINAPRMRRDRKRRACALVEGEQLPVIERREDVAVHRDERALEAGNDS